ncbi:Tubulin polyglutamylase TTLL4 [Strongyloides ratti]|uniref:Tubulin polyglutamylase TTLL4 n=1 Tax=Strongyloides ratti TaxID=34506 RepID=A0A090L231_STRRB|nr:Tubulin polyglutamylase TTLL4 [Strongyloides ratti]CEF63871.1 Tubulin polyglutamylase TTLL4 [Strongyloides ratti]
MPYSVDCISTGTTGTEDDSEKNTNTETETEKDSGFHSLICLRKFISNIVSPNDKVYKEHEIDAEIKKLFIKTDKINPLLQESLFENVPPFICFYSKGNKVVKPCKKISNHLHWCQNALLPIVMKKTLALSHFKIVPEEEDWIGYWGRHWKSPKYKTLKPFQKMNHFPGAFHFGRKDRLWMHLKEMMDRQINNDFFIMPFSYILPKDFENAKKYLEENENHRLILKPPASARGSGITLTANISQISGETPLVAQQYLEKPLLINGAKFDLRFYIYVPSFDPLRIYFYDDGLVRFASLPYSNCPSTMDNKYVYLTNYSINKNAQSEGHTNEPVPKWDMATFWNYLDKMYGKEIRKLVKQKIKDVAAKAVIACESYIRSHAEKHSTFLFNCHELFGMDIILDENFEPWLLEMNISPSLHSGTQLDREVKGPLAKDVMNMSCINLPPSNDIPQQYTINYGIKNYKLFFSEEHLQKQEYYEKKYENGGESCSDVLEDLTDADVRMLIAFEDEYFRRGNFELIYPNGKKTEELLSYTLNTIYSNILLHEWVCVNHPDHETGIRRLNKLCEVNYHYPCFSSTSSQITNSDEEEEDIEDDEKDNYESQESTIPKNV